MIGLAAVLMPPVAGNIAVAAWSVFWLAHLSFWYEWKMCQPGDQGWMLMLCNRASHTSVKRER